MALPELSQLPSKSSADELESGTVLLHGQYTITNFISSGGFGITYLAKDSLDRDVVIKECFASAFCRRNNTQVRVRSHGAQDSLKKIVANFLNEARALARLSHPNIVGVQQIFEENDTAYMVLDLIKGNDLLQIIESGKPGLEPDQIVALARKLVLAVGYVHEKQLLHGDVAPDNIFMNNSGEPILIDFGAVRRIAQEDKAKFSGLSVVKDGYSPHEAYITGGNVGAWSDLYSLAASLYHAIARRQPVNSQARLAALVEQRPDPNLPLAGNVEGYPPGFLESVDKAMSVALSARFQKAGDWHEALNLPHGYEGTNVKFLKNALGMIDPDRQEKKQPPPAATAGGTAKKQPTQASKGKQMAINISGLSEIAGFIGGCLVDSESGMMMASEGGGKLDLEAASAANTEVVRAKLNAIEILGLNDHIDDILISLGKQFHLIRPLEKTPSVFIYVALDKKTANLGLARVQVKKVEQSVSL